MYAGWTHVRSERYGAQKVDLVLKLLPPVTLEAIIDYCNRDQD